MTGQTFQPVSSEQWSAIKAALAGYGFVISSDNGAGSKDGVNFRWTWDSRALTITINSVSPLDDLLGENEQAVRGQIKAKVEEILGTAH